VAGGHHAPGHFIGPGSSGTVGGAEILVEIEDMHAVLIQAGRR
jgi:hypothetical protein